MHKKPRNRVYRGEHDGLLVEEQSDMAGGARVYPIIAATMARAGAAVPWVAHGRAHAELLCPAGHGRLFFARRDGVDYGAAFEFVTPARALGWLGGTRDDAPAATGNYLQWSLIERLSAEGVAEYDLGGVDTQAPANSKGARILKGKLRYDGALTEHCGATRTLGPVRARLHDRLMNVRRGRQRRRRTAC